MIRRNYATVLVTLFLCLFASTSGQTAPPATTNDCRILRTIALYLPNRLLDVVDVCRVRVRVGPGFALGARLTDYGSIYLGSYRSVYLGLPGPRKMPVPRSPVGLEEWKGIVLFGVDATDETSHGPDYQNSEIGVGVHLGLLGADVGVDPVDLWDLVAGFFFLDPKGDDW